MKLYRILLLAVLPAAISTGAFAALLGVSPLEPSFDYDSGGTTVYTASDGAVTINATPTLYNIGGQALDIFPLSVQPSVMANFTLDSSTCDLTGGDPDGADLIVTADIDYFPQDFVPDVSGIVLTGEISALGIGDTVFGVTTMDARFTVTGGGLVGTDFTLGDEIGMTIVVSASTFTGDCTVDWNGGAKGLIGTLEPAEACELSVTKSCFVPQPVSSNFRCDKPIDVLTMIWNGSENNITVKAYKGDTNAQLLDTIIGVNAGDEVTIGGYAGSPNDVTWALFDQFNNPIGQSMFHLSCSDDDMDGPEDCGKNEGNGKNNSASLRNDWTLEGIVDAKNTLNCTADTPVLASKCEIPSQDGELCTQRPTEISFRYHAGADCSTSNNTQNSDKWSCTDIGVVGDPVRILVSKEDGSNVSLDTGPGATINDDDVVTATAANAGKSDFDSASRIQILDGNGGVLQDITLHTSCSQDLSIGDRFGAIEVVGFVNDEQGTVVSGAEVQYSYVVTNTGDVDLTGIAVEDDGLDPTTVPGSPVDLLAGQMTNPPLMATVFASEAVTSTVTVTGLTPGGAECSAMDSTMITVAEPPPCEIIGGPSIKLKKKKLEWNVTNTGPEPAIIDRIELSWPVGTNGILKKIKIGKREIVSADEPGPSAVITSFVGDVKHRTVKPGKTVKLKFEFENNVSKVLDDYGLLIVGFAENCEAVFDPANVPFNCKSAKPIDSLSMIWNGPEPVTVTSPTGDFVTGVINGQEVTFSGLAGMGNDIFWDITGAVTGESVFHVSCSDSAMNGEEDCGNDLGDGKKNSSSNLNLWLFEGMGGTNGVSLDCTIPE